MAVATSSQRGRGAPGFARRVLRSDHLAGWVFVLPAVFLVALFSIFPIIWGFVLSLQKASLLSPNRPFIGFDNYAKIANDPFARQAAVNSVIYTFLFVPTSIIIALFLAVALNQKIRFIRFYRLAVFIPVAVSTIATGVMFLWVFDANFGIANWALGSRARAVRVVQLPARRDAVARDHDASGAGSGSTRSSTWPPCRACRMNWWRRRRSTARAGGRRSGT